MTLPQLPVENYIDEDGLWAERHGPYTDAQMREYAAAAVAAERERLHAVLAQSCDEERSQMWEAGPGGGCLRAIEAEAELKQLRTALMAYTDAAVAAATAKLQEPTEDAESFALRFPGAVAAIRAAERERCASIADKHARRDYPWGSENTDKYHAQAHWAERIAAAIRAPEVP